MATPIKVSDLIRVSHVCRLAQQLGVNVLHYVVGSMTPGGSVTDANVAQVLTSNVATPYKAYMPTVARFEGTRVQIIKPTAAPPVVDVSSAGAGNNLQDPLPTMCAAVVSIRTALAGRSGRGRAYLPFFCETQNDTQGKISTATITAIETWAQAALTPRTVTGAGGGSAVLSPVIYSRHLQVMTVVERWLIRDNWATQRRRSQINRGDILIV